MQLETVVGAGKRWPRNCHLIHYLCGAVLQTHLTEDTDESIASNAQKFEGLKVEERGDRRATLTCCEYYSLA